MELRHLRYFVAAARAGSITGAANLLHISQPALTYQLKQIELELGVQLLERNSRGVSLTQAGRVLLAKAEGVLGEFESIDAALAPFREPKLRWIRMGMAPTPARAIAADLMEACARSDHFVVHIREAFSDDLHKMVLLGEVDCALLYDSPDPARQTIAIPMASEALFAIASSETFDSDNRRPIRFEDLARFPLVLEGSQMVGRRLIDQVAAQLGLQPNIVTATSIALKKELIARNGRCTVGPIGLYAEELAAGLLVARRIVDPQLERTLSLTFLRSHEKSLVKFTAMVMRLVRKHIDAGTLYWKRPASESVVA